MRIRGVVLKKLQLREDDELIVCYTENFGKRRYLARSSMKTDSKQGSHLDVLNEVEFSVIEGRHNVLIASAMAVRMFPNLKSSLPALSMAFAVFDVFDVMVYDHDTDYALWSNLIDTLQNLDAKATDPLTDWRETWSIIERDMVSVLGYGNHQSMEDISHRPLTSFQFVKSVLK